jgi:hypothetical protein
MLRWRRLDHKEPVAKCMMEALGATVESLK